MPAIRIFTPTYPHTMNETLAVILGGGAGTRLFPLTSDRAKPAVPLAGKYRLVDVPISNCINSGLNRIFVLTQYNSASLNNHITRSYIFDRFRGGFVTLLAAEQTASSELWYQGTADAVRRSIPHIRNFPHEHIVILSGDQLYSMDYRLMLEHHKRLGADITIAVTPVQVDAAQAAGAAGADDRPDDGPGTDEPGAAVRLRVPDEGETVAAAHDGHHEALVGGDGYANVVVVVLDDFGFLEEGVDPRPSAVTYDRKNTAISQINEETFDWQHILEEITLSGLVHGLPRLTHLLLTCGGNYEASMLLVPEVWDPWLDRELRDPDVVAGLLQPIDPEIIMEHAVSSRVNSVKNNRPGLNEKVDPETLF